MALANIEKVREIGNLPDADLMGDDVLRPHLETAARQLTKMIGTYTSATGDKRARCIEAECCLTMYFAVPVLHSFFTEGITTLQKEIGELDFQFYDPDQVEAVAERWMNRAEMAVAEWMDLGEAKQIGWYAI